MTSTTHPFFIVSSGRSGTQMMEKLLRAYPQVDMHHEYACTHVQHLAVRYYLGLATLDEVCAALSAWHGSAIFYSTRRLWGDSSNKLSWLIEGLDRLFPTAKFIHLVRDGRKVTSSFFHKLADECYDDRSTSILQSYVDNPEIHPAPPPEKKYWWNVPRPGTPLACQFREFNQFQRMCFHWGEVNRWIQRTLQHIPAERTMTIKLESLVANQAVARELLAFLQLPYEEHIVAMLKRPHNVAIPQDFPLTHEQHQQLMAIAGDVMSQFGYDRMEEYRVDYNSNRSSELAGV